MNKMKKVLITSIALILVVASIFEIYSFYRFSHPSLICYELKEPVKSMCFKIAEVDCMGEKGGNCIALEFAKLGITAPLDKVCGLGNNKDDQQLCLAYAWSIINVTHAREICDLIEDNDSINFCHSTILKRKDIDSSLKECDNIIDSDIKYYCIALAVNDKDAARKYCEQIENDLRRKSCLEGIT